MNKDQRKLRKVVINYQQLLILSRIYSYRFVSTAQLQTILNKKQIQQVQQRLNLLLLRGWIGRNFSNIDRLTGRYASYYLLPAGLKVLKQNQDRFKPSINLNEKVLHNIYKDNSASKRFIDHSLALGDINIHLDRLFGDKIKYLNKADLVTYDYLLKPLPDAFIIQKHRTKLSKDYFLEYFEESVPFFVHQKRIKQYIEYKEEGDWSLMSSDDVPQNRFVAENENLQRKITKYTQKFIDNYYSLVPPILITNLELLKTSPDAAVWYLINPDDD